MGLHIILRSKDLSGYELSSSGDPGATTIALGAPSPAQVDLDSGVGKVDSDSALKVRMMTAFAAYLTNEREVGRKPEIDPSIPCELMTVALRVWTRKVPGRACLSTRSINVLA